MTLQEFTAKATEEVAVALERALMSLPEGKRNWSPMGNARTALDMVAECTLVNDITRIVQTLEFPKDFDRSAFDAKKLTLSRDWEALRPLFHDSVARAAALIRSVPDENLTFEVAMPWGVFTVADIISYPKWNMSYHEGQINYIASMLEGA